MINQIKTTKSLAIEVATNNSSNPDLELIGFCDLEKCSSFTSLCKFGELTESCMLRNSIGVNTDFFYTVECVPNSINQTCSVDGCSFERGVGYLYEQNNSIFLKRHTPLFIGSKHGDSSLAQGRAMQFRCCDSSSTVIVYASVPTSYIEVLASPHSVLCSSESFLPAPIPIQENSFLARLQDSIRSISFSDNIFINIVMNIVMSFSKHLKLQASKLTIKRLETNIIDLKPSKNHKAIKGSLVYDEDSNALMFYNGTNWINISG